MKVWVNDGLCDERDARISVFDHGFMVGDGVFETVKVVSGTPFAFTRHLDRLRRSATALGLSEPDFPAIRDAVAQVIEAAGRPDLARIRITVTAGISPLGSQRGHAGLTTIVAIADVLPAGPVTDVVTVEWPRNERGALAGVKTTSYAENVLAIGYAKERGASEAIFRNLAGDLCEGTGTNVFVVIDDGLVTPPLASGCLAGVTRGLVLEWIGAVEENLPMAALAGAEEAFLTSTTRNVQAIRSVDGRLLPSAPGPVTRKAMEVFAQRSAELADP